MDHPRLFPDTTCLDISLFWQHWFSSLGAPLLVGGEGCEALSSRWMSRKNHGKSLEINFSENHQGSSLSTYNHSRKSLVTPRHHLSNPWLILRTVIFLDFAHFLKSGPVLQGFPSRTSNALVTIGKNVNNHGDTHPRSFISWTWAKDVIGQRGSRSVGRRIGSQAIWWSPVTWRRLLRTTSPE